MNKKLLKGFLAGALGAVILIIVMYILKVIGMGDPAFVGMYQAAFGPNPPADQFIAALIFIISGGIWGLLYALIIKRPTVLNGFLFGILPTLWLWIAVNGYLGKPLFNGFAIKGIVMPVIFNMVLWGSFIGWYLSRNSSAVKV